MEETIDDKVVCDVPLKEIVSPLNLIKPCGRYYRIGELCYCPIEKYKKCEYVKGK